MLSRADLNSSSDNRVSDTVRETATAPAIAERTDAASASLSLIPAASIVSVNLLRSDLMPESKVLRNFLDCRGKSELRATIGHSRERLSR